ncbi:MAG: ACT domain-containing protein [Candidatus Hydrothermarchaeales archaeon]
MKVRLEVVLKDIPGQLVEALAPVSLCGGNIISIVHLREEIKGGRVSVTLVLEVEPDNLEKILKELEKRDIWVSKVDEVKKKHKLTVVLIGHVVDTDLRDTIDKINEIKGALVLDVSLAMPHPEEESSCRMDIEVSEPKKVKVVLQRLEDIAREKNLLVIKSLGV